MSGSIFVNFVDPTGRYSVEFAEGIAAAYAADPEGYYYPGTPPLVNDDNALRAALIDPIVVSYDFATGDGPGELRVQLGLFLAIDAQFTRDETGSIRFMGGGGLGLGFATSFDATPILNSPDPELGIDLSLSGTLFSNLGGSLTYDQRFQFEDGLMPTSGTIDVSARGTPSAGGISFGELYLQGGIILEENSTSLHGDAGFNPQTGVSHGLGAFATIRIGGNDVELGGEQTRSNSEQIQDPVGKFPSKKQ